MIQLGYWLAFVVILGNGNEKLITTQHYFNSESGCRIAAVLEFNDLISKDNGVLKFAGYANVKSVEPKCLGGDISY